MNEMKWIPVKERLPEEGGEYLVTTKSSCGTNEYYDVRIVEFTSNIENLYDDCMHEINPKNIGQRFYEMRESLDDYGEWNGYEYPDIVDDVTAWMPLPEHYKED